MRTMKTITIAAIAALALFVSGCTAGTAELITAVDDTAQTTQQYEQAYDDLDEYDEAQLMQAYAIALDAVPFIYEPGKESCADFTRTPDIHMTTFVAGFWTTAPDELRYLLTDAEIREDFSSEIVEACYAGI